MCQTADRESEPLSRIVNLRPKGMPGQALADTKAPEGPPKNRGGNWYPAPVRTVLVRAERAAA